MLTFRVVWLSIQRLYQYSYYTSWNHNTEPGEQSHCLSFSIFLSS